MPFSTETILTAGSILYVQKSGFNRTLPTITLTTSAIAAVSATSVAVTPVVSPAVLGRSAGQVLIQEGTKVTFNSTIPSIVTLTADVKVGDTSISFVPLVNALQSGNTATSSGLLQIQGCDTADFKLNDKTVSTKGFSDGFWSSERKTALGGMFSLSGSFRVGDPAFDLVVLPASTDVFEIYFKLLYPNRDFRQGYGFAKSYAESIKLEDIRKFSCEIFINGPVTFGTEVE